MDTPSGLARRAELVEAALPAAIAPATERLRSLDGRLRPWADALEAAVLGGGKRLRPALVLLGAHLVGADEAPVLPAALATELVHACALLHDDLIDGAGTRRGLPATHVAFAGRHAADGLAGDAARYGAAGAVLVGDLALVLADEHVLRCDVPAERLLAGLRVFTTLREEVMAGQALDVEAAAVRGDERSLALAIAAAKSGRYSVARPLQLGAVLAGGDQQVAARLAAAVEPLGQAFQVRDDLLGVFGDEQVTGKPALGDLREGKRTLLVVEALGRLGPSGRDELEGLLGDPTLDDAGAERARDLLTTGGGVDAAQRFVAEAVERGLAAVAALPLAPAATAELAELGAWLGGREA